MRTVAISRKEFQSIGVEDLSHVSSDSDEMGVNLPPPAQSLDPTFFVAPPLPSFRVAFTITMPPDLGITRFYKS